MSPVTDITPPEVEASLDFVRGGEDAAWFEVGYACMDASGVTFEAFINGVPVISGEEVHLVTLDADDPDARPRWRRTNKGKLTIWDFSFLLTVTCEDGAGNTTTATVVPQFR